MHNPAEPSLATATTRFGKDRVAGVSPEHLNADGGEHSRHAYRGNDLGCHRPNEVGARAYELTAVLADVITRRLPAEKKLLAVVGWCANGGGLFQSRPGVQRYAVSYRVQCA